MEGGREVEGGTKEEGGRKRRMEGGSDKVRGEVLHTNATCCGFFQCSQ